MEGIFRLDLFVEMDDSTKKEYLNTFNENDLIIIFQNLAPINILLLDDIHLISLLKNEHIKKYILDLAPNFLYCESAFNRLLKEISGDAFLALMDQETIKLIINSPRKEMILKAIVESDNIEIKRVLPKTSLMTYFISEFTKLNNVFENISKETAEFFFDYVCENQPNMINIIKNYSSENQWYIIETMGLTNFFKLVSQDSQLFMMLDYDVISVLIEKQPFSNYFIDLEINNIIDMINCGVILPENFSRNKKFINKISKINDPNEYRFLVNAINRNSFHNVRRHRWHRLNIIIRYLREKNLPIENEYVEQLDSINGILPLRFFEKLYDDMYLEMEREKYYDNLVNKISYYDNLLPIFYVNYEKHKSINQEAMNLYQIYYDATTTKLLEILIDRYYKDISYNFLINLSTFIDFINSIKINELCLDDISLINLKNRIRIYNKILNFYELTRDEQIELYNSFDKKKDYMAEFYDDFVFAKNIAYKEYNESVFNLEKDKHLINHELSNKYGVTIYELKGDPFYIFSHITDIKRNDSKFYFSTWESRLNEYLNNPFVDEIKTSGLSLSLNSSTKIKTFRSVNEYVAFGFCYLEPNRIAHVYHTDSYSAYYNRGVGMDKINEILSLDNLMLNTDAYNEILYQEISEILLDEDIRKKYKDFEPDYLLCFDDIITYDIDIAKKMNIPVLVVYTKNYSYEKDITEIYTNICRYITSFSETQRIKTYKKK